jgi:Glycosyl hydrolases family 16
MRLNACCSFSLVVLASLTGCSSTQRNDSGTDGGVKGAPDGIAPRDGSRTDGRPRDGAMVKGVPDSEANGEAGAMPVDAARDVGEFAGSCASSPVFADNFSAASAPGSGYTASGGTWVRSAGSYTVTSPNDANGPRGYALIQGSYATFDVTIQGHSIGGDGFGLVYATTGIGDGYAVIVHPNEYHGVFFKKLVPGGNDINIASAALASTIAPSSPFSLHVTRNSAGHVNVTLTGSALSSAVTVSGDEQGAPTTGEMGLVWSPTSDGQGVVFTDFVVTNATCVSTTDAATDATPGKGADSGQDGGPPTAFVPYSNGDAAPGPGSNNQNNHPWTLAFDDEFNETSLDVAKWSVMEGRSMNNVTLHGSNVAVAGGNLVLTLASSSSGGGVSSGATDGAGSGAYALPVGGYVEARVYFPGSGTTIYNWPAWWICGVNWPADGENDIAEGLGSLTENYHCLNGANGCTCSSTYCAYNHGPFGGTWSGAFHVYGLYRKTSSAEAYWDGSLVIEYTTYDTGAPQSLLANVGSANTAVYGAGSQVLVDYVRAWE